MKIIIPARFGSKGLPLKNRQLFDKTASIIPKELKNSVWVTTDDVEIVRMARDYSFNVILRPEHLAGDTTSTKETLIHAINAAEIKSEELVLVLYLTYPQRTWEEVLKAKQWFLQNTGDAIVYSMLCKQEVLSHPYLCMHEEEGNFGSQIIEHDLYRRQDYPKCFELSHYIILFKAGNINALNNNMYNRFTLFYPISKVIDVDTQNDLDKL
jgi:N-acylneuraminate cytidylyltransferase